MRPLHPFRRNTFERSFKDRTRSGLSMTASASSLSSSSSPIPSILPSSNPNNTDSNTKNVNDNNDNDDKSWAAYAMLFSSFTDGIERSLTAQEFFKYSLVSILVRHLVHRTEVAVRESVLASPCQGPDVELLTFLEEVDDILEGCSTAGSSSGGVREGGDSSTASATVPTNNNRAEKADRMLQWLLHRHNTDDTNTNNDMEKQRNAAAHSSPLELRVVYIPTAMYALRSDSTNTAGKQRQRARADGKKRRNGLVSMVEKLLGDDVTVRAVTLDLDDSSIKQPYTSSSPTNENVQQQQPTNGIEALTDWKPHLIYLEGGNTFWLQHCINKGSWIGPLLSACRSGGDGSPAMYMGKSAGAILAGKWMETASWKGWDDPTVVPGKEHYEDWKGDYGMNLVVGASIFPHMNQDWESTVEEKWSILGRQEEIHGKRLDSIESDGAITEEEDTRRNLFCLQEGDVCCVDGGTKDRFVVSGVDPAQSQQ